MYTRVFQATIKADRLMDFKETLNNEVVPLVNKQPGYIDNVEMYSGNNLVCVTFWRTRDDAERFGQDVFPQVVESATPMLTRPPQVDTYEVENSSVHKLFAGKAAA